ncbi:NAD(P)-binding protein [Paenibacillus ottowii]
MENPVIIIGAGLSGLRAATLLTAQGIECKILDARDRIGGRVLSTVYSDKPEMGKFDLGSGRNMSVLSPISCRS